MRRGSSPYHRLCLYQHQAVQYAFDSLPVGSNLCMFQPLDVLSDLHHVESNLRESMYRDIGGNTVAYCVVSVRAGVWHPEEVVKVV